MLGIIIENDTERMCKLNYMKILHKMREIIDCWSQRPSTMLGRILIVNTLMESLFVYKLSTLPDVPDDTIMLIEKMIDEFIWQGKKAKIARGTLQKSKNCGGKRLFDIRSKQATLKIQWVPRIRKTHSLKHVSLIARGSPNMNSSFIAT